jgi:hypothetical protein
MLGTDNIGLKEVRIEYWFSEDKHLFLTLKPSDEWMKGTLDIPIDEDDTFYYLFIIIDYSNNSFITLAFEVDIMDMVPPTIQIIEDVTIFAGSTLQVTANATDNIGVKTISWDGGPISSNNLLLEGKVTENGTFDITVTVTDPSGNWASTMFTLTVIPLDHDSDNDGIPDLMEMELGLDKNDPFDGHSDVDSDGLPNRFEFLLNLNPRDPDTDADGMPDGYEYMNGLDPNSPIVGDFDDDGISDLEEYLQGTDPRISDEVIVKTEGFDSTLLIILLILLIIALLAVWGFVGLKFLAKGKQRFEPEPEPDLEEREEEELEKMLHDLPVEQPVPEPQYDTFDFEPSPEGDSQVSDLFSDEEIPQAEPPSLGDETAPDQRPESEPFAEQPIQTLEAGEVIQ